MPTANDVTVLFVDDEADTLSALKRFLRKSPYTCRYAQSGTAAMDIMADTPVHVLVTDMKMPQMNGVTLLARVRQDYPDTIRLALSAYIMADQLLHCINTGGIFRFITKPIVPEQLRKILDEAVEYHLLRKDRIALVNELRERNGELRAALDYQKQIEVQLRELSVTDALTGLFNRRILNISLAHEIEQCKRYQEGLSCLILDLDHFKGVNDTYGHGFGDYVLSEFAARMKKVVRKADLAFRYGGEEFVLLMPHAGIEEARRIGQRIIEACKKDSFAHDGQCATVTVSIGAACFSGNGPDSGEQMLTLADRMLYQAKANGRDRIELHAT